jgi:UPF0271 protein
MKYVDLNADLGESFGAYTLGMDEELLGHITSANVACGFHAGDAVVMERTARLAEKSGVAVGAHPGYPDLAGFGRREMSVTPDEARCYVKYQLGALMAFAPVRHVKLHGALYNRAAMDVKLAEAVCRAVREVDPTLILLGLSGSAMREAAGEAGLRFASEVFADRAYMPDGTLAPRSMAGAVIRDEETAIARTVRMVREGLVRAADGTDISIAADSVCVHGDNPAAVAFARAIRGALMREGIGLKPLSEFV